MCLQKNGAKFSCSMQIKLTLCSRQRVQGAGGLWGLPGGGGQVVPVLTEDICTGKKPITILCVIVKYFFLIWPFLNFPLNPYNFLKLVKSNNIRSIIYLLSVAISVLLHKIINNALWLWIIIMNLRNTPNNLKLISDCNVFRIP